MILLSETARRREKTEEKGERESSEREIETGRKTIDRETETRQKKSHAAAGEHERTR